MLSQDKTPTFVPVVRVTRVLPTDLCVNMLGAFTSYQSFLAKGSWDFFFPPFFPLLIRLFLPTCHIQMGITSTIHGSQRKSLFCDSPLVLMHSPVLQTHYAITFTGSIAYIKQSNSPSAARYLNSISDRAFAALKRDSALAKKHTAMVSTYQTPQSDICLTSDPEKIEGFQAACNNGNDVTI